MKTVVYSISILLLGCCLGCEKDEKIMLEPNLSLSFEIEQSNSDHDFIANAETILKENRRSGWRYYSIDSAMIIQEITFNVLLSIGDSIEFGFWFIKYEKSEYLNLENDSPGFWERNWDYKDFEIESQNFYNNFDEARVLVNNNVISHQDTNADFKIEKVEELVIQGVKKSYIEVSFSGTAHGWFDPSGEFQEVYKITNGHLKGVLE